MGGKKIMSIESKLLKFQSSVDAVKKDTKNPFFKSMYSDINGILKAITPTLTECGISYSQCPNILENGDEILITKIYDAEKPDSYIESRTRLIMAKRDMQQYGSAMTYARRYAIVSMLGLESEDDDGNSVSGKSSANSSKSSKPTQSTDDW